MCIARLAQLLASDDADENFVIDDENGRRALRSVETAIFHAAAGHGFRTAHRVDVPMY
jgi:hypothetical protein